MDKMTKKEKREMIAAAMKTISQQTTISESARNRGLITLQKAYQKHIDSK